MTKMNTSTVADHQLLAYGLDTCPACNAKMEVLYSGGIIRRNAVQFVCSRTLRCGLRGPRQILWEPEARHHSDDRARSLWLAVCKRIFVKIERLGPNPKLSPPPTQ